VDGLAKPLLAGVSRVWPKKRFSLLSKAGRAYGFSVDNAYIVDQDTGRGVFVAAAIYTNADGILNDDAYDYQAVADPFFSNLGEVVARTFLERAEGPMASASTASTLADGPSPTDLRRRTFAD
jgi:hypothetical protein